MNSMIFQNWQLRRSKPSHRSLVIFFASFIGIASIIGITMASQPTKSQAPTVTTSKTVRAADQVAIRSALATNQTASSATSQTITTPPSSAANMKQSVTFPPPSSSIPKSPAPPGPTCPFEQSPNSKGITGTVPSGIFGPSSDIFQQNLTNNPAITLSTANGSAVTWTPESATGQVYITSPGTSSSRFSFQLAAQPSAIIGQIYWVYIDIVFPDSSTAKYSLPVSIGCT